MPLRFAQRRFAYHRGFQSPETHPHLFPPSHAEAAASRQWLTPGFTRKEFQMRRKRLLYPPPSSQSSFFSAGCSFIPDRQAIILQPSYRLRYSTGKIFHPFHQSTNFAYLTGLLHQPDSLLMIEKHSDANDTCTSTLFVPRQTAKEQLWEGQSLQPVDCVEHFGVERAAFTDEFWPMLLQAINRQTHSLPVYVDLPLPKYGKVLDSSAEQHVYWPPLPPSLASSSNDSAINPHEFLRRLLNNGTGVTHRPLSPLLHRMRLIKSNAELEQMRQSARHSCKAFAATLRQLKHSKTEHELAARFEYECKLRGSSGMSYVPVVAGRGVNACTIHYTRNDMELKAGELLLLDAGGEWNGYASDITRTVPISGRFTETQRRLYDTLQLLQRQLIAECRSDNGMTLGQLFQQSVQLIADRICRGLFGVSAGGGDLMALVRRIYPHHIGHWLGMDVHDCSQASQGYLYGIDDGDNQKESSPSSVFWWKHDQFRDGMVVTVEPGIYIPPADYSRNLDDEILQLIPQEYRGIGIRIEDDIVINGRLPENLTRWLPTESTLLEEIINSRAGATHVF